MAVLDLFKTTISTTTPPDESSAAEKKISAFLTVESLANFGAMTGGITAAWGGLTRLSHEWFAGIWTPYAFAFCWFLTSLIMSRDVFYKDGKLDPGVVAGSLFVGFINALVLATAVAGIKEPIAKIIG